MRSFILPSFISLLHLIPGSSALPTAKDGSSEETMSSSILPRAGTQKTSVATSKLSSGLYWSVVANVNGQDYRVMIDTGSSDFWLKESSKTPSPKGDTHGAPLQKVNGQYQDLDIHFGAGEVTGPFVSTEVKIGNVTVPNYGVGIATLNGFGYPLDGMIGLDYQDRKRISVGLDKPTFMDAAQSSLQQPIFTVGLKPNSQGSLNFGYVDKSLYTGDLVTAPLDDTTPAWLVSPVTLSAGKAAITQKMFFDTGGADTMKADSAFVSDFWQQVSGSSNKPGYWTFPCSSPIPDMSVGFGKAGSHPIKGSTFNAGPVKGLKGICRGALQAGESGSNTINAGAPFFLSFFMVFNLAEPSISFAPMA